MLPQNHTFSIETKINPVTRQPYGPKYAGTFEVRRPSIADKYNAAAMEAASRNAFGFVPDGGVSGNIADTIYIMSFVKATANKELPAWFNPALLFDESDEAAVGAVWSEVQAHLKTFRPAESVAAGGAGSEKPPVLVSAEV